MDAESIQQFDASRDFSDKSFRSACYAPFVSLYFDQLGFVRVCCQNGAHSLGNVAVQSLDEIWRGEKAEQLRRALRKYNFNLGCQYCKWQIADGNYMGFLRQFDRWPVESDVDIWPAQMEFSVSNTCNLACVMCNGEWSSVIRSRREKLPPLPKVYGDGFFEDLRKYLPHLKHLKVLGGEPFLQQESFRIWDMIMEQGLQTPCHVTTNGTVYNEKVERVLDQLPVSFSVSMDGATKETVERVRVNARYEQLLENFKKFHAYAKRRGTGICLTYCLMTVNWQDFGDYLLFADDWDCEVVVNTVIHPPEYSLYEMPIDQLSEIVQAFDEQSKTIASRLGRNRTVWTNEVDRLRHRCQNYVDQVMSFVPGALARQAGGGSLPVLHADRISLERTAAVNLRSWSGRDKVQGLICDQSDVVVDFVAGSDDFFGLTRNDCIGRPIDQIYAQLRGKFGQMTGVVREEGEPYSERWFGFTSRNLQPSSLRMITFPRMDEERNLQGTVTLAAIKDQPLAVARGGA